MYSVEIKNICNTKSNITISRLYKDELIKCTEFLDNDTHISDRIYYVINEIYKQIMCPVCGINKSGPTRCKTKIKSCSTKCANNRIDPHTGLSKKDNISNTLKKSRAKVNLDTGLTRSQEIGQKIKDNNLKIDLDTGLTRREQIKIDREKKYNIIGNNGKTLRETSNQALSKTLNTIQKSGLSLACEIGKKTSDTKSQINPETGLSYHYDITKKSANTRAKIDPETGLTINQVSGKKNSNRLNETINGIKLSKIISNKSEYTKSQIDPETGLTINQVSGKKIRETHKIKSYKKRLSNFPEEYTLLTTKKEYLKSNLLKYKCNKCGSIRESYWPYIRCTKCYPYNKSLGENEVLGFCESLGTIPESNNRQIIPPLELDIYLPDHKLAIEYNGLFWHSSYSLDSENETRHFYKTKECEKQGIQLFHIFENEWQDPVKQNIWKSIISNRLGQSDRIYARKTEIRSVSSKNKTEFLNSNHLQGNCNSSVNLGLYLGDELVSLMTFGKSRYDKKIDWELLRFCNKLECSVVGGVSKLLKRFTSEYSGNIISYADKRRSNGNLYKQLGFELSHESSPNYWYYKDSLILESRIKYQKHKLKDQLDVFDNNKTESENMYENGYRKIYDCGNQVWKLINE